MTNDNFLLILIQFKPGYQKAKNYVSIQLILFLGFRFKFYEFVFKGSGLSSPSKNFEVRFKKCFNELLVKYAYSIVKDD